jgi:hypothetical protein
MSVPRGQAVVVKVPTMYRQASTFRQRLPYRPGDRGRRHLGVGALKKADALADYKVPCATMRRWLEPGYQEAPKWRVDKESSSRTQLKKMGAATVLSAMAEKELMMLTVAKAFCIEKHGRKLSMQRAINQNRTALAA